MNRAPSPLLRTWFRALRPHQWAKNVLVFVPIVPGRRVGDLEVWWRAGAAFVALSLVASALYLLNDFVDLEADRRHPVKRLRPFASGELPVPAGLVLGLAALSSGAAVALMAGVLWQVGVYAAGSAIYSLGVKRFPLVDVFLLAFLYTVRVFVGGEATGIVVSVWLFGFSVFLFLGLATMKRAGELSLAGADAGETAVAGRSYSTADLPFVGAVGVAASFAAAVVLALYVQSAVAVRDYPESVWLWGLVPVVLFWQLRLWLATSRGYMHSDPVIYALRDRVTWLVALCCLFLTLVAAGRMAL